MAERDGAAVDVQLLARNRLVLQHREHLRRERFVQFDEIEVRHRQSRALKQLAHRRHRADAHDARIDAGRRPADDARERLDAERCARAALVSTTAAPPSVMPDDVPGGDDAGLPFDVRKNRRQLLQRLECRVGPRMLVRVDDGLACPSHPSTVTGAISSRNRPSAIARAARRCVSSA